MESCTRKNTLSYKPWIVEILLEDLLLVVKGQPNLPDIGLEINLLLIISPIHLFYNLQLIYWHFVERLWLFIYIVLYSY